MQDTQQKSEYIGYKGSFEKLLTFECWYTFFEGAMM